MLLEHMQKKFEINRTGSCQLGRKVVTHNSKSDLPLVLTSFQGLDELDCSSFKCIFQVALELKFLSAA